MLTCSFMGNFTNLANYTSVDSYIRIFSLSCNYAGVDSYVGIFTYVINHISVNIIVIYFVTITYVILPMYLLSFCCVIRR